MKRIIVIALIAIMALYPMAYATQGNSGNLGITTEQLLVMFGSYLQPIGGPFMPLDLTEAEKTASRVTKPLTRHCTISIHQENGMVTNFRLVSDESDGSDAWADELMMCFLGAVLLLNIGMDANDGIDYLTRIVGQREEIDIGQVHYRFISTQPISTSIGLEVTAIQ